MSQRILASLFLSLFFPLGVSAKVSVVATTTMVAELVKFTGGHHVEVVALMGPNVDPHSYQPKMRDMLLMRKADLILYSGLHLEGNMQKIFEKMRRSGKHVYAVSSDLKPEQLLAPQMGFQKYYDPHIWGDPELWADCVPKVESSLAKILPKEAKYFSARANEYATKLNALSVWAIKKLSLIPKEKRILVTSHDAFFYFGRAFDFEVKGLQGISTISEVGLRNRANLVKFLREKEIPTIFPETTINSKGIGEVAKEANVRLSEKSLFSDAMGNPGDMEEIDGKFYDLGTYEGMFRHNVNAVFEGLIRKK